MINESKKQLFEMMNKVGGMPLNEMNNYDYPEGSDNSSAPWNQDHEEDTAIESWEINDNESTHEFNVIFTSTGGETSKVDIDMIVPEEDPMFEWFGTNSNNPEFESRLQPYIQKWVDGGNEVEWDNNSQY